MKLSFNWLKEYVNLDNVSVKDFCTNMTMTGSKVETYESVGIECEKVVTGKVLSIEKHPDAEKLVICKLDVTENFGGILQMVTGAKNLKVGDIVPVALHGASLPNNIKIKKSNLRGKKSEGMMCSLGELGLNREGMFKDAVEDGIFVLPNDTEIGKDIKEVLKMDDYLIDFEITPNRPDCLSVIGLAREAAVTFDKDLILNEEEKNFCSNDLNINFKLNLENSELCPYYSAKVIKGVKLGKSPDFIKKRLNLMGVKSINNVVDITNYVMLEYGQPLHAFDFSKINGNTINIRTANEDEKLTILDGTELNLNSSDLVIADENSPIALAGIMGGLASGINSETIDIVLESANFDAVNIRRSSKFHNIRTEASSRYEKGLPVENCKLAIKRACSLIKKYCSGENTSFSKTFECGKSDSKIVKMNLDSEFINKFLNTSFSVSYIEKVLKSLGFVLEKNEVVVPFYRKDIENKYDIAEEMARIYGYNNIKSTMLKGTHFSKSSNYLKFKNKISSLMLALGASETVTFPFESPDFYEKMLLDESHFSEKSVKIKNPLGLETSLMRVFAESSMLKILTSNLSYGNKEVNFFEISKEYVKNLDKAKLPEEKEKLVAAFCGENVDFFYVKGILEELFIKLRLGDSIVFESIDEVVYCHPGICASIKTRSGLNLGYLGKLHPLVCKNYELSENVFLFKLDIKKIFKCKNENIKYKPLSHYPAVERDISLVCDESVTALMLENVIKASAGPSLESLTLFDIYRGNQIESDKKSMAFKLVFRDKSKTLKEETVENSIENIRMELEKKNVLFRSC